MKFNFNFLFFFFVLIASANGFATQRLRKKFEEHQLGNYTLAAVSIDGKPCAQVGLDVLLRNGSAVDAAVAAMFCNGVHVSHSMGIGGGLMMTVYQRSTQKVETLIARERAPAAATEDMFHGDPELSQRGGLSIGVPGQILGLFEAKEKYGNPKISWASLVQPSIDMCRNGVTVSPDVASALQSKKEYILQDPGMKEVFVDPNTGDVYQEGDVFKWPKLAETLQRIADKGASDFYTGESARLMIEDLQKVGSIITMDDLKNYRTQWEPSLNITLGDNLVFHSVHPPASGAIIAFILNILKNYELQPEDLNPLLYHRVTEAFKWSYAIRSKLGDPSDDEITDVINEVLRNVTSDDFTYETFLKINDNFTVNDPNYYGADFYQPEDHGTSHMGVVAPNGDAVAITSTINQYFGAVVMSPQTGVIMNDEMDDFSSPNITSGFGIPPSPNNFIKPGKIPLSSTCPTIIIDEETGEVRLVTGASGGTQITSQVAMTAARNLWLGQDLKKAADAPRIHHQLMPMELVHEENLAEDVLDLLEDKGHILTVGGELAVVNTISREKDGRLYAYADQRKDGATAGF